MGGYLVRRQTAKVTPYDNASSGLISSNVQDAIDEVQTAVGSGSVSTSRTISTTAPLSGGGDLSANRTLTTSMATNKLIGRGTSGTGVMEEISLGTNLTLTGTTLDAAGSGAAVANLSGALIGMSAANGAAATAARSDATAAIDPAITPTWTGAHTWSLAEPRVKLSQSGATTDEKLWDFDIASKVFTLRTRTDADGAGVNAISITRGTGTALSNISFGNATNNPTFNFLGTGLVAIANTVTAQGTITGVGNIVGQGALIQSSRATPAFAWSATGQSTDLKNWLFAVSGTTLTLGTATDASTAAIAKAAITIVRGATTVVGSIAIGNATDNPAITINGALTLAGGGATTGAQTATFSATNKPGAGTGAPTIWIPVVIAATTYWVPGFAN